MMISWIPLCGICSSFIVLLLFPGLMWTHPLYTSETPMLRSDTLFSLTTPVTEDLISAQFSASQNVSTPDELAAVQFNAAYMARVYGKLGINYDIDNGRPFIYCEKLDPKSCAPSDPQCPVLEQCYAEPENRAQRLGCMTVFKYITENTDERKIEVTLKGCWQHDKEVIADCKVQDECVAESRRRQPGPKMEFCCCRSHMCNKKVSLRIVDEPRIDVASTIINGTSAVNTMSHWMSNIWFAMLFALIGICVAGSLIIFSVVYRRCWQNGEKVKSQTVTIPQQSETCALLNCPAPRPTFEISDMKHLASGRFGDVFSAIYHSAGRVVEVAV
ncbi:hypothetical protein KIN20_006261 [Parelaphostrongylus tenuis]|uniref:Uncharacterized protein n=1 Tax=Parelaphostrongylus tenuis TaxID=148309 RepID=A0AAD5M3C7_PARTN|nr:hypothetical protein KIN20_006261 [Parelaphostrongylus tenuis]